jgi:hypothetical protein
LALIALAAGGCAAPALPAPLADARAIAAAEATAIIQRAEATALVLQAHVQATALIHQADGTAQTPSHVAPAPLSSTHVPPVPSAETPAPSAASTNLPRGDVDAVQLLGVSLGDESGLILVQFIAPPAVTRTWQQNNVYVEDEANGARYDEVPVMPVIGPLFAHPKTAGQIGYVMFVNAGNSLLRNARVTVVLGRFRQEHVVVQ